MTARRWTFVDESRRGAQYFVCATTIRADEHAEIVKSLRTLRVAGQRRIHFSTESDRRRRRLLDAMTQLQATSWIYRVEAHRDHAARTKILSSLVHDLLDEGVERLCLESRASLDSTDRRDIAAVLRSVEPGGLDYGHSSPYEEPALWIPDAYAWAYGRGRDWRRRLAQSSSPVSVRHIS